MDEFGCLWKGSLICPRLLYVQIMSLERSNYVRNFVNAGSVFILFIAFFKRGCGSFRVKYYVNANMEFVFLSVKMTKRS